MQASYRLYRTVSAGLLIATTGSLLACAPHKPLIVAKEVKTLVISPELMRPAQYPQAIQRLNDSLARLEAEKQKHSQQQSQTPQG
jgi:hypothetical protein